MKKLLFIFFVLTSALHANCYYGNCANTFAYVGYGGGAVFPTTKATIKGSSSSVLYSPTIPGTSLFSLPNVTWEVKYKSGYELFFLFGLSGCYNWRFESEFLYQNLTREITGHYDWRELNAITGTLFAENANNSIHRVTNRANIYALLTNMYYDWKGCSPFSLSVGGGFGVAWLQSNQTRRDHTLRIQTLIPPLSETAPTLEKSPSLYGTAFAWQFKASINHLFSNWFVWGLDYRLFGTTRFRASESSITTNPDTPFAAKFKIPKQDLSGFLNNSLSLQFTFLY